MTDAAEKVIKPATEFTIRDATIDDLTGLVARGSMHHKELKLPWPFDEESTVVSVLKLMDAKTLLVEDSLMGYFGYELGAIYFNYDEVLATEHFWYVLPSNRNTGLGMALLEAAKEKARNQGATYFSVQLPPQSKRAIELAEAGGFKLMHNVYGSPLWPDQ